MFWFVPVSIFVEVNKIMKIILFGAGRYGRLALNQYGDKVEFFVDNNKEIQGKYIHGIKVISFEQLLSIYKDYEIVISTKYEEKIISLLEEHGITNYSRYTLNDMRYFPTDELVVNPYDTPLGTYLDQSEAGRQQIIEEIDEQVQRLVNSNHLFSHVEIETINRCNGLCSFCPVSKNNDTRVFQKMSWELFTTIIDQLADLDYSGKLALFSNNEPFLDDNIIEKHKYAREKLPYARMHLFTNGTMLTIDKFVDIVSYLDELIIDNYHQELKLIKTCADIVKYCENHPELKKKVTIVLRKREEILSNRGGTAPNKGKSLDNDTVKCTLPFKQLIIRPDGKVSLCCNDPLGKNTLGDLKVDSLVDVWFGEKMNDARECLSEGRGTYKYCKCCDVLALG